MTWANLGFYVLGAIGLIIFLSLTVMVLTWIERKFLARIQQRMGPMRVGPHGLLQPIADVIKLISKEDILPSWADKPIYWIAPLAIFVPAIAIWVTIPFSESLVLQNLDLGLFYIAAISVLSVLGLVMAGWGSANKYSMLGGLRAVGQLISYEIPFIMAILGVAMLSQSLSLIDIINDQSKIANIIVQPIGFLIFLAAGLAELGRTPFDIHHAESEVVGGPFVEYSGAHWAIIQLAEYVNTFAIAALIAVMFLGGWSWPSMPFNGIPHHLLSVIWFLVKIYAVILLIFWIRGTYPRLRIDQLMSFGWKVLVPVSFINIVFTGFVRFYNLHWSILTIVSLITIGIIFYLIYKAPQQSRETNSIRIVAAKDAVNNPPENYGDVNVR
ncbi:MAG: NADH-quinone oxidoreductase subunit NuoH [SAR202 cluster bacterium]|nr:NADH-quinone oxidoreductase subunit NuoH [SAR202 cluster bacterium]|tara:strand:- start:1641 stop:2792 length:1152 start_codon:yes stop_codon:yes gene_type:complete